MSPRYEPSPKSPLVEPLEPRVLLASGPIPIGDFAGIPQNGNPPDPICAAGPDNVLAMVNYRLGLYEKDGTLIEDTDFRTFYDAVDHGFKIFDPWVVYDPYSNRYVAMAPEMETGAGANEAYFLIGISTGSSPDDFDVAAGDADNDWHVYSVNASFDFGNGPTWADYPKLAVDADSIYITSNNATFSGHVGGQLITRLAKGPMLSGTAGTHWQINGSNAGMRATTQPAQSAGRSAALPQLFVEPVPAPAGSSWWGGLRVWELDDTNTLTKSSALGAPFQSIHRSPQAGTYAGLIIGGSQLMNAVWRDNSLWTVHAVSNAADPLRTFASGNVNLPIPDQGTRNSTISVSGLNGLVMEVDVTLNITHPYTDDLDVYLISPSGTRVELFTDVGGGGDNFVNTKLDDGAQDSITTGSTPFTGTFRPEGFLSELVGEDPNGQWTLEVTDDAASDTGTLINWSMDISFGDATVRWYEIDTTGGSYSLTQSGDIDPGRGVHTYFPAVAVDAAGNMAITYTQSSPFHFPDMMVAGRRASDPAGYTTPGVTVKASASAYGQPQQVAALRWGDYGGIALDPGDGRTFFAFHEYAVNRNAWGTWWGVFTFETGGIEGAKYRAYNANGLKDASEPGVPGWRIYLDLDDDGMIDQDTATVPSADVPVNLPDLVTSTSRLEVSGLSGLTTDVNVTLNITHPYDGDLDVYLYSPWGTRVELFTDVGGSGQNFTDTTLDGQAGTSITLAGAPFTGTFRPEGNLAAFNGENPNGTWTLEVTDDAGGDVGTLNNWSITIAHGDPVVHTDGSGRYSFSGLGPGDYVVREELPPGWLHVSPASGRRIATVRPGQTTGNVDFGNIQPVVDTHLDEADGNYSPGHLSLREALALARGSVGVDIITFDPSLNGRTIQLNPALGELVADSDVKILGPGADQLAINANRNSRVFNVSNASAALTVEIAGLSITRGYNGAGHGGGIYNTETLTVRGCAVYSNEATGVGGGIYNSGGTLRMIDSVVHENFAAQAGGGIHSYGSAGDVDVHNTTISGNWANQWGGGVSQHFGTLEMVNVTVADNMCDWDLSGGHTGGGVASLGGATITLHNTIVDDNWRNAGGGFAVIDDISGTVNPVSSYNVIGPGGSGGLSDGANHNQVGVDARLGPLADNGGPTPTHKLLPNSPAIDAGKDQLAQAKGLTGDQRGFPRFMNVPGLGGTQAVDIGAYEYGLVVSTAIDESDGNHSSGNLSLRETLELARAQPGTNTITFDPSLYGGTISLINGWQLTVDSDVHIQGPGADLLVIDGPGSWDPEFSARVFFVSNDSEDITVEISGLSITDGRTHNGHGGGIYNTETLTVRACDVHSNQAAGVGGGIYNSGGTLRVVDSAVHENFAAQAGGGVHSYGSSGDVGVYNTTISGNWANQWGGGISQHFGTLEMVNATVAGNTCDLDVSGGESGGGVAALTGATIRLHNTIVDDNWRNAGGGFAVVDDIVGAMDPVSSYNVIGPGGSGGLSDGVNHNRVGVDAKLGPLADNGGPTRTHAIDAISPAIDAGKDLLAQAKGLTGDQRGVARFIDILTLGGSETVDVGAYEYDGLEVNVWLVPRIAATSSDTSGSLPTSDRAGSFWQIETCDYTIEVWVRANQVAGPAIGGGSVKVTFAPDYAQAISLDHGSVYTLLPVKSIDNSAGAVTIGGATLSTDMGDDEYVCLGRVLFHGIAPVDEVTHKAGPYDMGLNADAGASEFTLDVVGLVGADIQPIPGVDIRANIYDIDDNGQVAFNDFTYFAPAYGGMVGQGEPPFFWWADFDRNGQVGFNDFTYFAPAYTKPFCDSTLSFPAWWYTTYVTRSAPQPPALDAPAAADEEADMKVLTGDVNGDGRVSGRDRRELRGAYGSAVGDANYSPLADLNVDGRISSRDRRVLRDNYGTALSGPPVLPAAAAAFSPGEMDSAVLAAAPSSVGSDAEDVLAAAFSGALAAEGMPAVPAGPAGGGLAAGLLVSVQRPSIEVATATASFSSQVRSTGTARPVDAVAPAAAELEPDIGTDLADFFGEEGEEG